MGAVDVSLAHLAQHLFSTMLDLITLISTMGVQQELRDASAERKENLVIREEDGQEGSLVEQAADSMSSAFQSFEDALSEGISSIFGSSEEAAPVPGKKVD